MKEEKLISIKVLLGQLSLSLFGREFSIRCERDVLDPEKGRPFLQIFYTSPCTQTGQESEWYGRKWYLSQYMTEDEIVKTCYAAFEAAVKHEVMEGFKFNGKTVFNPHANFRELLLVNETTRENE